MSGLAASAWLIAAFAGSLVLVAPSVRRTRLGIVHPAVAWLALEAVLFGIGSAVLALGDQRTGPALYVGAAVTAFAAGVAISDRVARRRNAAGHVVPAPNASPVEEPGIRRYVPLALGLGALAVIAPILLRSGIPFLTVDITGSRAELVGLPVQLVRVALPALAIGWWFALVRAVQSSAFGTAGWTVRGVLPLIGVAALGAFAIALASRYLVAEMAAAIVIGWLLAGRRIPARPAAAIVVVGIVAFVGIGVIRAYGQAQGQEGAFALERTTSRIVLVQPRTLAALMDVIPAEQPYFLGATWIHRLGPLIGRPDIPNLGYWIYPQVVAGSQDTAGYAAPGLIGEAWANLGPAGLLLFALLGVLAERLGVLVAHRRERLVDIVAGALAILFLARTHALGLGGFAILALLVVAWRVLAGRIRGPGSIAADIGALVRWRDPARPASV